MSPLTVLVQVGVEVLLGAELVGELADLELDEAPLVAASGVVVVHYVRSRLIYGKVLEMIRFNPTILISSQNCG